MVTTSMIDQTKSLVGLFRQGITSDERLKATTVARQPILDDLLDKLRTGAKKRSSQHFIFIGPRGIGKTHFMTMVENAITGDSELADQYLIVRFPEENNRLLSFADFLLGVIDIVGEVTKEEEWLELYAQLSENDDDNLVIDTILPRLKQWAKDSGRKFLIILENLDMVFTQQIKKEVHIHQFRTFLMDSPSATLIGTSPVYFAGLANVTSPLYDFFDIQVLDEMSEPATLEIIRSNLEWDKRVELLEQIDDLRPRIRAIHAMTGGNPRLIMMLYELIAKDNLLEVKAQFQMLLDKISPFYQDRLKELAPQERALLETLALMRTEPRTPGNIAKKLRKSPQQTSVLLKRMVKSGYLVATPNPSDRRSNLYRIKEGFFDIWLAMSESRAQRRHLGYLVDFLNTFYTNREDREQKRQTLCDTVQVPEIEYQIKENHLEMLDYLTECGDTPEQCQNKMELALHHLNQGTMEKAKDFLMEVKKLAPEKSSFIWMTEQGMQWAGGQIDSSAQTWLDEMVELWRTERIGDLEQAVEIAQRLGVKLSGHGLHQVAIEVWRNALSRIVEPKKQISLMLNIARSEQVDGRLDASLATLEETLQLACSQKYRKLEGTTLNNISQIYDARGEYETALSYLKKSLAIQQEIGDNAGLCATLFNMGHIHAQNEEIPQAIQAWITVYRMAKPMNLAQILDALANLAPKLGLPEGLEGWEILLQQAKTANEAAS